MSEEIKVGSQVIVHSRYNGDEIETVIRETKLYWLVGDHEQKFRKADLRVPGGDSWRSTRISLATPEKIEKIQTDKLIKSLMVKINRFDLTILSLNDLQVISDVLDKYRK